VDFSSHPLDPRWWASLLIVFAVSSLLTWLSIGYAHRLRLIDHPGQRRSHSEPTPRGGGIGIVAVAFGLLGFECFWLPREALPDLFSCMAAIALVAGVGWIDDHRGLARRWRILAHAIAALLVIAAPMWSEGADAPAAVAQMIALGVVWLSLIWSINLHNFMDGINGLLAWQSVFVFAGFGALMLASGAQADSWHHFALAFAVAGFIPFNFPRARVFMGDVGSGALGLLIGIAALRQLAIPEIVPISGLILVSAFVIDASCNLVSRMLRGKRWYSAHREHLYQWMVRSGMSHARVVAWYMGWNLAIVLPVLWCLNLARRDAPTLGIGWAAAVYAAGIALWIIGKRWCLQKVRTSHRHAPA